MPVWWYKASGPPVDASLFSGNLVAFSLYPGADYQLRRLDGTLMRTVGTVGTPTDFHELKPLLNGNFIVTSYKVRDGVDLSPYGGPSNATVQDAEIQEINPSGAVVWRWNSKDHIPLSETPDRWWSYILKNSVTLPDGRKAYDPVHLNAVEPDGTSLLISARHLDAIYSIDRSTGNLEWKVGGRTTSKSLAVVGDNVTPTLGGQHDVRRLSDGTVSVYDNNTDLGRPPRVLRFRIDLLEAHGDDRRGAQGLRTAHVGLLRQRAQAALARLARGLGRSGRIRERVHQRTPAHLQADLQPLHLPRGADPAGRDQYRHPARKSWTPSSPAPRARGSRASR